MSLPRMLCDAGAWVFAFGGDETHMRDLLHLPEEKNHGHDQTRADADREIEDDRERERGDQHAEIRARSAP